MPRKKTRLLSAAILVAAATAFPAYAFDYSFLNQAPIRYFSDTDIQKQDAALQAALNDPKSDASRSWQDEKTGTGGEVKSLYGYAKDGMECRRVRIVTHARQARRGTAASLVDMCKVGATWKFLNAPIRE
jgi:hypothetical protein